MSVDLTPEERAKIVAERASVKYGPFASLHEAYGVLAEEIWELSYWIVMPMILNHEAACHYLNSDNSESFVKMAATMKRYLLAHMEDIGTHPNAEQATSECIDVIAVCDRIIAQWGDAS